MSDTKIGLLIEGLDKLSAALSTLGDDGKTLVDECEKCAAHYATLGMDVAQVFAAGKVAAQGIVRGVQLWEPLLESWQTAAAELANVESVKDAVARATGIWDGLEDLHAVATMWQETVLDLHSRLGPRGTWLSVHAGTFNDVVSGSERTQRQAAAVNAELNPATTR